MSLDSVKYTLQSKYGGYEELVFYFDFLDTGVVSNVFATGSGADWRASINNFSPLYSGNNTASIINATGESEAIAINKAETFINSSGFDLNESNIKIPLNGVDLTNTSIILDFSFHEDVSSGVLFGAYEKEEVQLPNNSFVTGSKGYNVGVTDRGHLFLQGYSVFGDFVEVFSDKELTNRNCLSIDFRANKISLGFFNFFEQKREVFTKNVSEFNFKSPDFLYLGGTKISNEITNPENTTFGGKLNAIYGFSKKISNIYDVYEGFLSDYFFEEGGTGFLDYQIFSGQERTYKTGVVGYEYFNYTGFEPTSRLSSLIGYSVSDTGTTAEGEIYQQISQDGRVIANIGYLSESISNQYNPTGFEPIDTLGLQLYSTGVNTYEAAESLNQNSGQYEYTLPSAVFGETKILSGVENVYQATGEYFNIPDSSGLNFGLESIDFKPNYIYYKGIKL